MSDLVNARVSWVSIGEARIPDGTDRTGTIRAIAFDQVAQSRTALVEPDDGGPFSDLPAVTLRPVRKGAAS